MSAELVPANGPESSSEVAISSSAGKGVALVGTAAAAEVAAAVGVLLVAGGGLLSAWSVRAWWAYRAARWSGLVTFYGLLVAVELVAVWLPLELPRFMGVTAVAVALGTAVASNQVATWRGVG